MGITPINMTHITSNSLLSPTKSMVPRGNQWYPITNSDGHLKFLDYQLPIMVIRLPNMNQTLNFLLSPTKLMVVKGNQW